MRRLLEEKISLRFEALAAAIVPTHRARLLFHPKRGWFRRLERGMNNFLSSHFFPYIPGIAWPYGFMLTHDIRVSFAEIGIANLPNEFEDTRILLLSDIHLGPFVKPKLLEQVAQRLMQLEPELVILAGDLVTARLDDLEGSERMLQIFAKAKLGAYATFGNHEHYTGNIQTVAQFLKQNGISVLHNSSIPIEQAGTRISLAGVDDWVVGKPDLDQTLREASRPVILISHNPDALFEAAKRGVDLVLAGHTHAGQVRIPGLPVIVRQSRYHLDEGRYRFQNTELVVSRGLGVSGIPLRVACPPEAVLLKLRLLTNSPIGEQ